VLSDIHIRNARLTDAVSISELISQYARSDIMLPRTPETIIEEIRNFFVAEKTSGGELVGCCAVAFFTEELAEIRSVAVKDSYRKHGVGRMLITQAEEILKEEGIKSVFALTLAEDFFAKLGYKKVEKSKFPQKIWRDCLGCSKIMQCDEVAVEKRL
jgi:amino-acid N-acetyltransferase